VKTLSFVLAVQESNFDKWNYLGIVLLFALKLNQVVIGATRRGRKLPARARPSVVDRTFPRLLIEKHASLAKETIGSPSQDSLLSEEFGVTSTCHFRRHPEMSRNSSHVSRGYLDAFIDRATVSDAFVAIILEIPIG
jgi:hypothetical protein